MNPPKLLLACLSGIPWGAWSPAATTMPDIVLVLPEDVDCSGKWHVTKMTKPLGHADEANIAK